MPSLAFKTIGALGYASYAAARLCAKLPFAAYYRFKVVAVPVERMPQMPRGYSWRPLERHDLGGYTVDIDGDAQAERFAQGLRCLGVFDRAGELAGITWIGTGVHVEPSAGIRYLLPARAAWDTGLWVPEEKRMTRAFSAVWAAVRLWLEQEGLDSTLSSISDYNVASILSHRRLGGRDLRTIIVLRLGPLQLSFGARPFLHLGGSSALPTVTLDPARGSAVEPETAAC